MASANQSCPCSLLSLVSLCSCVSLDCAKDCTNALNTGDASPPQSLVRIPETLVCAMEFITMATPSDQNAALEELRKLVLRNNPDLKDKSLFWKRRASVLKVRSGGRGEVEARAGTGLGMLALGVTSGQIGTGCHGIMGCAVSLGPLASG